MLHSAHEIRVKLVWNWEQSMLYTKSLQVLHWKGIHMFTDSKVFSLTCKCVFYRPELNAKGEPMELNFAILESKYTNG